MPQQVVWRGLLEGLSQLESVSIEAYQNFTKSFTLPILSAQYGTDLIFKTFITQGLRSCLWFLFTKNSRQLLTWRSCSSSNLLVFTSLINRTRSWEAVTTRSLCSPLLLSVAPPPPNFFSRPKTRAVSRPTHVSSPRLASGSRSILRWNSWTSI